MSSFCKRNTYTLSVAIVAAAFTSLTFAADYDSMTSGSEASTSQQPMAAQMAPAQENASSAERASNAQTSSSMNRGATQSAMSRSERWSQRSSMSMAKSGWPSSPNESFPSAMGW